MARHSRIQLQRRHATLQALQLEAEEALHSLRTEPFEPRSEFEELEASLRLEAFREASRRCADMLAHALRV